MARTRATVLVTLETGTGKELIARLVHARSDRADRAFVAVNCGAIADSLVESDLFHRLDIIRITLPPLRERRSDLYGEKAGGIARRTLVHDTSSGEWWDVHPIDGSDAHRNTKGPYNGHPIKRIYRARQVAVKKAAAARQPAKVTQDGTLRAARPGAVDRKPAAGEPMAT